MLSSLSSTIITVFDIADPLPRSFPRAAPSVTLPFAREDFRSAAAPSPVVENCDSRAMHSVLMPRRYANANGGAGRRVSGRRNRRDVHDAAAERDIEPVSAEQIHQRDEDEQKGRLPARLGADEVRLSEHRDQHDGERHQRSHTVHHADKATGGGGQRERNRDELKRQIDRGEPGHVEAEPFGGEEPEYPVQAWERSRKPEKIHLPQRQPQGEENAQPGNG